MEILLVILRSHIQENAKINMPITWNHTSIP